MAGVSHTDFWGNYQLNIGNDIPGITVTGRPWWESNTGATWGATGNSGRDTGIGGEGDFPSSGGINDYMTPEIVAGQASFFGKLKEKYESVKDVITDPAKAAEWVLKSVTGMYRDKNGWHWDAMEPIGTAAALAGVGPIAKLAGANQFLDFLDLPHFSLQYDFDKNKNRQGDVTVTDLPPVNQHVVVPYIGAGGKIEEIVVGSNDGSDVLVLTADDFSRYGIDPGNLDDFDWASLMGDGGGSSDGDTTTPPGTKPKEPDKVILPNDPGMGFGGNNPIDGSGPGQLPGGGNDAGVGNPIFNPNIDDPLSKTPTAPDGTNPPGAGGGGGTNAPPSTPSPPSDNVPNFSYFAMPEFKILSNSFGDSLLKIGGESKIKEEGK